MNMASSLCARTPTSLGVCALRALPFFFCQPASQSVTCMHARSHAHNTYMHARARTHTPHPDVWRGGGVAQVLLLPHGSGRGGAAVPWRCARGVQEEGRKVGLLATRRCYWRGGGACGEGVGEAWGVRALGWRVEADWDTMQSWSLRITGNPRWACSSEPFRILLSMRIAVALTVELTALASPPRRYALFWPEQVSHRLVMSCVGCCH